MTKDAPSAKLCHISVGPQARALGFGSLLARGATDAMRRAGAHTVRVTTSEGVSSEYGAFFRQLGFAPIDWSVGRYRPGTAEVVWSAALSKLEHCTGRMVGLSLSGEERDGLCARHLRSGYRIGHVSLHPRDFCAPLLPGTQRLATTSG